jgi:hypothetical protein
MFGKRKPLIPAKRGGGFRKTEKASKPLISKALFLDSVLFEGEFGG